MGTETVLSTSQTNRDAFPRVPNDTKTANKIWRKREVCTVGVVDAASTYNYFSLPSNAVVMSVKVSCPSGLTSATMHLGLSKTTVDGGAVVDADFFKASVAIGGALTKSEAVYGNIITVAHSKWRLWEHLVLSVDPYLDYDVVGTLAIANGGSAGAVLVEIDYKLA